MIELTIGPLDRVMTLLAGGREAGMRHRTLRAVVIILMARNAQRAVQVVVIVDVAIRASARRNHMRSGQRPASLRVVEFAIRPVDGVMALFAGGREAGMRHRTRGTVVVIQVARNAGRDRDVVIVVDVAVDAGPRRNHMRTRQRPASLRVVEFAIGQ